MSNLAPLSSGFGPFHGRIWLNCAHQGPLPARAQSAAIEALELKRTPARLSDALFVTVPERLRSALARLINARPEHIALTNSTSYGLNLLAQGLPWRRGDEILCVDGDFPATVVPWLPLEERGVRVRLVDAPVAELTSDRLASEIRPRTRAICVSWVFSFFGHSLDLVALGRACHERNVLLFVNGSQAIGARPLDVEALALDALSCCGFKWLCGPYATGFAWLSQQVLEQLNYPNPHWLRWQLKAAARSGVELDRALAYERPEEKTADAYDVFCAPNFLNFMAWTASVEHLLELGVDQIEAHDQALVERLIAQLPKTYRCLSPADYPSRSTLVLLAHHDHERNPLIATGLERLGVDVALRDGKLRLSPHLYNSGSDIDAVLERLQALGL